MLRNRSRAWFWLLTGAIAGLLATDVALARQPREPQEQHAEAVVALSELPTQGQQVWRLIQTGGPFRYDQDGVVFGNRERLLPPQTRGFYREYTVPTPGLSHRGARRIVCGGLQPRQPEVCYYSADHYASFARIVQ